MRGNAQRQKAAHSPAACSSLVPTLSFLGKPHGQNGLMCERLILVDIGIGIQGTWGVGGTWGPSSLVWKSLAWRIRSSRPRHGPSALRRRAPNSASAAPSGSVLGIGVAAGKCQKGPPRKKGNTRAPLELWELVVNEGAVFHVCNPLQGPGVQIPTNPSH